MCDVKERKALSTPQGPYYIRNIVLFFRIGWLFVNGMIISGSVKTKCWRLKCPNMFKYLPRIRNTQQINYFINCASPASKTCYISCALSHLTHCLGVKKISRWFSQFWERWAIAECTMGDEGAVGVLSSESIFAHFQGLLTSGQLAATRWSAQIWISCWILPHFDVRTISVAWRLKEFFNKKYFSYYTMLRRSPTVHCRILSW